MNQKLHKVATVVRRLEKAQWFGAADTLHRVAADRDRLRLAVEKYITGDYPHAHHNNKCQHGVYGHDTCGNCIDEYFLAVLAVKGPE
jgi:hypothetical protein